jgi:integrase
VRAKAATLPKTSMVKGRKILRDEKELMRDARRRLRNTLARKYGGKYCLYSIRHSTAHRLLVAGVDNLTVSTLLGHQPGSQVLAQHYAHLDKKGDYLRGELSKVKGD